MAVWLSFGFTFEGLLTSFDLMDKGWRGDIYGKTNVPIVTMLFTFDHLSTKAEVAWVTRVVLFTSAEQ